MDAARHTSCHWFRKDLRLHDNPALKDALDNADCFYGVFVLSNFHPSITSGNRWKFLLQCLQDLNNSLEELGSKLIILTGSPVEIFPKLLHSLKVTKLTFEVDTEPFAQQRDSVISHIARSAGIEVKTHASHTLYDIESLVSHCNENIPLVFDEFLEMISGISLPPIPVLEVKQVPCLQLKYLNSLGSTGIKVISSLKDVPCNQNESTWEGGETVGLQKLEEYLQQMVRNGFLPEVIDADVLMSNKGVLCPYLRFGCLSPRTVYFTLKGRYQKTTKRSAPPRLFSSLLWREFAFLLGSRNPDMHKTEGNSYCLQVPWRSDQAILERLRQGMTGFPWIDAIIRQLRQEGWVHDVAQQAVGCFLTWGTLWQSWEEGFKLFGELMLDAGWSRNAFNWLNMSNSMLADGPLPYFCPVDVGKAIDPSGRYIRKYIPELASFPSEFIHAPWTAPEEIQRDTQCVIGDDYPYPLVDHKEQRKINIQALQSMCKQQDNIPDCPSLGISSMHWFRKDLRLHDNPALLESFKNCQAFYGVYFLDPASVQRSNLSPNRWWFLLESLRDLDYNLRSLGSRLLVVRGQPVQEMPKLLDQWNIKRLTLEYDSEPPAKQRDAVVTHLAKNLGVEVIQRVSHTLYDVETVFEELYESDSYATWDGFLTFIDKLGSPEEPVDLIDWRMCHPTRLSVPETSGSNFDVPTLHELGINPKKVTCDAYWKGGEGAGLERLKLYVVEATKQNFIQPPICAEMLQVRKPHLGPYLRFGCVSPRHVYKELRNAYSQNYKMEAPVIVFESLLRREFYFYLSSANSNFCNMENNPISLQFPWEENKEGLKRWKEGKTGFPWIDAMMRQLREEGWIHHLARQAVGCFLTRGCLWVSWEEGFKAFDELQLDAEWSLNAGNWLWLSCSSYVNGAVPWYCPVEVGKQIDPTGDYIKRYVPEVRGLPSEYVCEPWNAPLSVQKACRCVVGEDYPSPIVDHMEQRMICVQRMQQLSIDLGAKVPDNGCTSVHWFRKDLRLHDNPSLLASLDNCSTFFPIYVLDMESARASKISANRWNFLCECLEALDRQLRVLGSRLFVIRGRAMDVLPRLFHEWSVNRLTFERESEPAGRQRDAVIQMLAEKANVQVLQHNAHLLYDTDEVLETNDGKLPMTFDEMAKTAEQLGPPCPPCQTVDKTVFGACLTPVGPDHADKYGVPLLSEFGMKELKEATAKKYWTGGEPEALRRLSAALKKCAENDFEERGWTIDEMFSNDAHLSPYMRFGCLSPRLYYQQLALTYMKEKKSIPPATLFTGLVRRELFLHVASHNADLDKMVDNPLSVQFPWEENREGLERWKKGKTGFPWIDAMMRQLREEGWIHHLARQAVGCFLTRGCLWVSWEEGFKAFDELQLDAEWSLNASNWLWLSCSSYVHGAVPWYCPVEVGKKVDPTGDYIKRYVPEVRGLPSEYVCEPWNAPLSVQKACRCVVGEDYPSPIVDHMEQRMICVQRMQQLSIDLGAKVPDNGCTSVHWFRKDLRLHDNPSLLASLDNCSTFFPIYVLDMESARASKISANRWNFLCECLEALDRQLRVLGSRLFVIRGRAMDVLPRLFHEWSVNRLTFERESEPAGRQRDAVIQMLAEKANVQVLQHNAHLLYDTDEVLETNDGKLPMTFDEMAKTAEQLGPPCPPCQTVDKTVFGACLTPVGPDHADKYGVPLLSEFGMKELKEATAKKYWTGGEPEALRRLSAALKKCAENDFEERGWTIDEMFSNDAHLSPYMRFGCLSPRLYYQQLALTYMKEKKSIPPATLFTGLVRRELFLHVASHNADLDKMLDNPLSVQFPWEENKEGLERWKEGKTGFPWIDAIMRQLREEGWIHHLARQAVGCFLTRGCLWVSWEEGFKAFDELQLDAEWSLNASNWLWLSCSSYVHGAVPWYCPVEVGKKVDPTGDYIKRYVPEVRGLPSEYVCEPWNAPLSVQKACRCVVGEDYPSPIVDHMEQRMICVQRMQQLSIDLGAKVPDNGCTSVHWFRKDLRLHDNPSLLASLDNCSTFFPIYVLDMESARASKISANRWNFLCECLEALDRQLRVLGSRLFVIRGRAMDVLPRLFHEWSVNRLTFERESEPAGRQRDAVIQMLAEKANVQVLQHNAHLLYDTDEVLETNDGKLPMTFDEMAKTAEQLGPPCPPCQTVDKTVFGACLTPVGPDHADKYGVPLLSEFGMKELKEATAKKYWTGGEPEALRRLSAALKKCAENDFEERGWTIDEMFSNDAHLSPYMRFGCLSPRLYYQQLALTYMKEKKSIPPATLFTGLVRRELFLHVASHNADLDKMVDNPLSVQFPWEENREGLERWKKGKTGFPWIDAMMRQLREEGWIHHLARQAVGCFLTRGCLWVSWEEGFKAFDELQLDAEWSLNASNWLWLSCSSYVHGAVPWYCPVEVGKKVDPTGDYIKRYVPEVRGLPSEYVCEPWNAPLSVQKACRCVVGEDYPSPIVDHMEQRMICVQRMQQLSIDLGAKVPDNGCTSVHWFRKDLRLHDNPSLLASLDNCSTFFPIYVLDMESARASKISANRWNFLCECLEALDRQLRVLGSRLFVIRGRAMDVLPRLFHEWSVNRLTFERESEPAGRQRDAVIQMLAEKANVQVLQHNAHLLYDTDEVLETNDGKLPMTFDEMAKTAEQLGPPCPPCQTVDKTVFGACLTPVGPDHADKYGVPLLSEFGMKELKEATAKKYWTGGEPEALRRLSAALKKCAENDFEERGWTIDEMFSNDAHLSPYMRFGCLSPRLYYQQLALTYMKEKKSIPPATLFTGLVRRELFLHVASHNADLDKMLDNPLSVQFPWEENKEGLERWKEGKTGFPWIDAIMRQLREEGWIHHLARQAVGCFLTRGCLWVSWEEGFKAFDELQLDAEWSLNASNWLWLSCSSYVHGAVPWYCPVEVGKKVDPTGDYIKRYVPEVRGLPSEYVCEPWNAPLSVQKACRCVVGEDYPSPIVDHMEQRMICVQRMQQLSIDLGAKVPDNGCTSVHWFRKDLRLHDNPSLLASLDNCSTFFPIYVLDMESARASKISANRWNFLCECLEALDRQLRVLGSRLFVIRGRAMDVLPRLFHEWSVNRLTFERESEPAGRQRDAVIQMLAEKANVQVLQHNAHLLYDTDEVLETNDGKLPMTFDEMAKTAEQLGPPCPPCQTVDKTVFGACLTPVGPDHADKYGVPLLSEFGMKELKEATAKKYWTGGEPEALRRLSAALKKCAENDFEERGWTIDEMFSNDAHLSPYMRFGCLSPRLYYQQLALTYMKEKKSIPPATLFTGLVRRELFLHVASHNADLDKMLDNPLSVQFPWEENKEGLERWKEGKTGFPWIDAIMRQLREEGWIHHLARQAVGCFLTRGCLWVSWEEGFKAFDELQLDAEWSLNASNWLWLSCSSYVHGAVPWYCPVEVGKKVDPTGDYIKRYVPEVRGLPSEYVCEPWNAPLSVQKACRCVVGEDYPSPIVDHMEQRMICVQKMQQLSIDLGAKVPDKGCTSVHWFRKDLRLHDNPSLLASLDNCSTFFPIYVLDMESARASKISANRWNFLCECLEALDRQLRVLGSRLFVIRGRAIDVLPRLFHEWSVNRLTFERESEPAGRQRDTVIQMLAENANVQLLQHNAHLLYDTDEVLETNDGKLPMTFDEMAKTAEQLGPPCPPCQTVDKTVFGACITPVGLDHAEKYGVPQLSDFGGKELGRATAKLFWKGGELEAMRRLNLALQKIEADKFDQQSVTIDDLEPSDMHLSPYFRYGCLSPRFYYHRLRVRFMKTKGFEPSTDVFKALLVRELFLHIGSSNPDLHRMLGNPVSVMFPWEDDRTVLFRWKQGTTGFPWIDAIMRQLHAQGWIHHLARQAVGCFLTRGCLWVSWEEGFKAFDELQLDAEWSLNAGNWLWLSCSSYVHGAVPWYCPVEVGKKLDPTGKYIRKYVPEVRRLPLAFIYEPWKAPLDVQIKARCVVGDDYPEPVCDHLLQRRVCVERLHALTMSLPPKTHNTMHWFRKDLRLHDNPSLLKALSGSQSFYGVYFLDPDILAPSSKVSPRTLDFLLQCLRDLDDRLRGYGSRLFVIRECALSALPGLLKKWDITRMSFEADQDPHAVTRDVVAKQIAAGLGVEVISEVSHTIFDTVDIREASGGLMPQDFPSFQRAVSSLEVRTPVKEVDGSLIRQCVTCVDEDHDIRYGVAFGSSLGPKLKKAGRVHWKGGETEGLKRLELVLTKMRQKKFIKPPLSADTLLASDRALSPYMRFGCLSPCYILDRLTTEYQRTMGSKPPETLYTNLLWREFFFATASTNPDHHRMMGNPLALQIPWEQHPEALSLWKQGKTGFPWIDAIMRQLREEGWIHHLARQAVGCFLTRGCLWVSWEEGFKAFDELQLDAEWSLNAGNWLWLSCSSYVHGAVPWYCPVEVGKQVDPTGEYIRTFVPELRRLPTKFLHEPWKAPSSVQREAGCIVGKDYPQPMVNHLERRVVCVQKMQNFTQTLALLNG